jgi:hypothetical protein
MTISQIPGAVRLRENQFGIQTVLNTAVVCTRRVPWRGGVIVNQNWTDPDIDEGSLDPVAQPYPGPLEVTSTKTGIVYYNDLPLRLLAGLKGGVSPTTVAVTGRQWDFQVASLTSDVFDIFTNETADDTEATDTTVGIGGLIDSLEDTYPQDGGAVTINDNWFYSTATIGSNGTNGLNVDVNGVPELAVNTLVRMDSNFNAIGTTELVDTVKDVTVRVQNAIDRKRFLNGSNGANKLGGYGRGDRVIELVLTVAKTAAMITEKNTYLTVPKPSRYFDIINTSTSLVGTAVPYSDRHRGAFRLFEIGETEIGGNVALVLTYRAYYDSSLGYAYRRTAMTTIATSVTP